MYDDFYKKCHRMKSLIRSDYSDAYHEWREGHMTLEEYIEDCFQLRLQHITWINTTFTRVVSDDTGEHVRINEEAIQELTKYAVMVYNVFINM